MVKFIYGAWFLHIHILGIIMFGMSITQSDGSLWMSPEFTPQNLINKGTMSTSKGSVFQTSIPSNKSCFF
ncbi:TPA: hypothetical protein HNC25_11875, partial [Escherichia coli]|nr:hypothetical protein [Escherichia coli]EFV8677265.1 hypothetical protein [Shigella sonnei]EFH8455703.1 hypothetical protein [Escherichia coli]EFW2415282.1 hypothetical protein [Shigella sonnei]EFW6906446.1 hypothetical protein [Shigella sonnei]